MSLEAKRTLIFAVLKFLKTEINAEATTADVKESLEVASQCLESCYEISLEDEICKNNFDGNIDLIGIAEKSVIKKEIAPELKEKANNYKNEGNELMKQEKYAEALDAYNKAIEIDKSNAVYYCNRAAAHSKLADYLNSIEDCKNALKIDPTYSKAWGRLGLAFLSNNQMEEAYEAYNKAISLEPSNEGYKQNLKIVEDKLKNSHPSGVGPDMGFGNMGGFMNMFNNPQFINMATQLMSDPQMQNMMSNIMGGMGPGAAAAAAEPQGIPGMPGGLDFNSLLQAGQQFAQQMQQRNPELLEQLRQQLTPEQLLQQQQQQQQNNNNDNNKPESS